VNTPLLSNKGEFQMAVHTGFSGTDPQFAYALTDEIGVMLNGSFANRNTEQGKKYHKHAFVEVGGGYYKKFLDNGRLEVFSGYGLGMLDAKYEDNMFSSSAQVKMQRFFLQPAVGAKTQIFDGSFAARLVVVHLHQDAKYVTAVYLEPAITAKLGYKYAKAVFQFGMSLPLTASATEFLFQPFLFSVGLQGFLGILTDKPIFK